MTTPIQEKSISLLSKELSNLNDPVLKKLYFKTILKISNLAKHVQPYVSADTSATNRAFSHALFSAYPKKRYIVGLDARFVIFLKSWLPEQLYNAVFEDLIF